MEAHAEPIPLPGEAAATVVDEARVRTLVRDYLVTSTAFLLIAGVLGILMRQSQANIIRLDTNFFYSAMTAHGLGAFVAWAGFAVMGAGFWVLRSVDFPMRPGGLRLAQAAYWFMVVGTLGIVVSTLFLGFAGSWVFLYPLPFHSAGQWGDFATALFSASVLFAGLAIITWCLAILHTAIGPGNPSEKPGVGSRLGVALGFGYLSAKRFPTSRGLPYPVLPLAVIGIDMIIATLPLALLLIEMIVQSFNSGTSVDPLLAKNVLWFFGHPVVYLLLFPAVAVYYLLIPRYAHRPMVAGRIVAVAWLIAVISNVIIWAHHNYLDYPEDTLQGAINTAMQPLTFTITLVSALSLYSLSATIWRSNFEWTPASGFLVAGMAGWLTAGLSGVVNATIALDVAVHNTLWIVGHFHHMAFLNIGAVAFGAAYAFVPEITGKQWYSRRLGNWHLGLTLVGGYGSVIPWLIQGLDGAPRRFAVLDPHYTTLTAVALPFVTLIAIGQLLFAWNLTQTLRGKVREEDAQPLRVDGRLIALVAAAAVAMASPLLINIAQDMNEGTAGAGAAKPAKPAAPAGPGKQLFADTCGSCHTLKAAGTTGSVGPNLDSLEPNAARVSAAIAKGGTGSGAMPPNLLSGEQAEQVAAFVAKSAGK